MTALGLFLTYQFQTYSFNLFISHKYYLFLININEVYTLFVNTAVGYYLTL